MQVAVKFIVERHPDEYNEKGFDIQITASTIYKGECFSIKEGGQAKNVEGYKKEAVRSLEKEINYILFLRKRDLTVEDVLGVSFEAQEIEIKD